MLGKSQKMDEVSKCVLIVQEQAMHPQSVVDYLTARFEKPSVLNIREKDALKSLSSPPVYDDRYLLLFDNLKVFEGNIPFIRASYMFLVVLCVSKSMREDAVAICQEKSVDFEVYVNEFNKSDAKLMIRSLASESVSESFCDSLVSRVGLSPQRIISAIMVLEQVGYKTSNITKYIDKNIRIDVLDVIESLLHICRSRAQVKRAALYIHLNRMWYNRYTRAVLLKEVDSLIQLYQDFLNGTLTSYNVSDYSETHRISRHKIVYAGNLLEKKSLLDLLSLRRFLADASILEVAMRLS